MDDFWNDCNVVERNEWRSKKYYITYTIGYVEFRDVAHARNWHLGWKYESECPLYQCGLECDCAFELGRRSHTRYLPCMRSFRRGDPDDP